MMVGVSVFENRQGCDCCCRRWMILVCEVMQLLEVLFRVLLKVLVQMLMWFVMLYSFGVLCLFLLMKLIVCELFMKMRVLYCLVRLQILVSGVMQLFIENMLFVMIIWKWVLVVVCSCFLRFIMLWLWYCSWCVLDSWMLLMIDVWFSLFEMIVFFVENSVLKMLLFVLKQDEQRMVLLVLRKFVS